MIQYIIYTINILFWSITPFISKFLLKKTSFMNLTILSWVYGAFVALFLIALINHKNINILWKYDFTFYALLFLSLILGIIAGIAYNYLLQNYNANVVSTIINPLSILVTALLGVMFFNEPFTKQMWIGCIIMVIGLVVFISGE